MDDLENKFYKITRESKELKVVVPALMFDMVSHYELTEDGVKSPLTGEALPIRTYLKRIQYMDEYLSELKRTFSFSMVSLVYKFLWVFEKEEHINVELERSIRELMS